MGKTHSETMQKANQLLDFINQYAADHDGAIPSRREMATGLGMSESNTSLVNYYLNVLKKAGAISFDKHKARTITRINQRVVTLRACPRDDCQYWTPFFDDKTICPHHGVKLTWRKYREL